MSAVGVVHGNCATSMALEVLEVQAHLSRSSYAHGLARARGIAQARSLAWARSLARARIVDASARYRWRRIDGAASSIVGAALSAPHRRRRIVGATPSAPHCRRRIIGAASSAPHCRQL